MVGFPGMLDDRVPAKDGTSYFEEPKYVKVVEFNHSESIIHLGCAFNPVEQLRKSIDEVSSKRPTKESKT